jgi:hypothetical protein
MPPFRTGAFKIPWICRSKIPITAVPERTVEKRKRGSSQRIMARFADADNAPNLFRGPKLQRN